MNPQKKFLPVGSLLLTRIFATLLIPLACWQLWLFTSIPNYYLQHFFVYPCALFMLWALKRNLWSPADSLEFVRPFLPWLALIFATQALAHMNSARLFLPGDVSQVKAVLFDLCRLGVQVPFVLFFAILCRILMREEVAQLLLVRGACWSFVALAIWCAMQMAYVYDTPSILKSTLHKLIVSWAPWLEARWVDAVYNMYEKGSYTLTTSRVNGFFEEASVLSAMTGVFFVPLAFGLMGKGTPKSTFTGACLLFVCLAILLLCCSVTGLLLLTVTFALLMCRCLSGRQKFMKIAAALILSAACLFAALAVIPIPNYLKNKLQYSNLLHQPRIIATLDTLDIIMEHPLIGVGRNWYFAHLHQGRRWMENLSDPELYAWKASGRGGELATLPALAAQYGLPIILAATAYAVWICLRLRRLRRLQPENPVFRFASPASVAWLILAFTMSLGLVDIRNPLFCLPFFCFHAIAAGNGTNAGQRNLAA
ncbi:MAG: hypothetical protein LBS77_00145 [Desulfovibrio sp.]|jgi:hypothetical protein|nr:hypothetical protein [Desulfovibrio sp.]